MGRHSGKPVVRVKPGVYETAEGYRLEQAIPGSRGVGSGWEVFTPDGEPLGAVDSQADALWMARLHRYGPPPSGYLNDNAGNGSGPARS